MYSNFYSIGALVLIPLHEVFIYPIVNRCYKNVSYIGKLITGVLLRFVYFCTYLALITYARYTFTHPVVRQEHNTTLACLFHATPDFLGETLDYKWAIFMEIVLVLSDLYTIAACMEFYCAQVPYSMKGIFAGCMYGFDAIFMTFSLLILLSFRLKSIDWGTGTLSCGFWYSLTILVYMLITFTALAIVAKWYKQRKREDVLPNEHIFAENYYSKD